MYYVPTGMGVTVQIQKTQVSAMSVELEDPCECGGKVTEETYKAGDGITYWRLWCKKQRKTIGYAVVCPVCKGLMTKTAERWELANDDEYTRYKCSICGKTQNVCTFSADDGK